MNYQDPKFDAIFGNNISAAMRLLEVKERNMKKFSITESAASLAIRQITEQKTAASELNKTIASLTSILNLKSSINQIGHCIRELIFKVSFTKGYSKYL